jgi:hypothetical protein
MGFSIGFRESFVVKNLAEIACLELMAKNPIPVV